jgi:hypothetical protein
MKISSLLWFVLAAWTAATLAQAATLGAGFSYQGRLTDGGAPANGDFDLRFVLYDDVTVGSVVAGPVTNLALNVSSGLLTTTVDFGASAFTNQARWIEIAVRVSGGGPFVPLAPRQALSSSPNALYALTAGTATSIGTSGAAAGQVLTYNGTGAAWSTLPADGVLRITVLNVDCQHVDSFATTWVRVATLGTFSKIEAASAIEITYHGRVAVDTLFASETGVIFELRVDDTATTNGRARTRLRPAEVGGDGVPAGMTGIFTGLDTGTHTVSIWARAASYGGTYAAVDPGCWQTDHAVVKELK